MHLLSVLGVISCSLKRKKRHKSNLLLPDSLIYMMRGHLCVRDFDVSVAITRMGKRCDGRSTFLGGKKDLG